MENLSKQQQWQEDQYAFPYHYLPRLANNSFSQVVVRNKGYEYLSYIELLLSYLEKLDFNSLLDVGCGDGRFVCEAVKRFPHKEFVGTDYSERAILMAKAMCPQGHYIRGDITSQDLFERPYDVIVSIETVEHIPLELLSGFIQGMAYYLKDDGYLLLTTPSKNIPVHQKHYQHFSQDTLQETLSPYFEIQQLKYLNKSSSIVRLVTRLLSNRVFILREPKMMLLLYRAYLNCFLHAKAHNGIRLFAVCQKTRGG